MLMERNTLMEYVYPKIKGQITIACSVRKSLNDSYQKINVEQYQLQKNFGEKFRNVSSVKKIQQTEDLSESNATKITFMYS
jgi:hypothetical protein